MLGVTRERVKAALDNVDWPSFVKHREWQIDVDSTGEEALWIWVFVSDPEEIRAEASSSWRGLRQAIRKALTDNGVQLWPYVRARSENEQPTKRR